MTFAKRSARRRGMVMGAAIAKSRAGRAAPTQPVVSSGAAESAPSPEDVVTQVKQLAELRDQGILTEEEFAAKKKQLLGI